MRLIGIPMPPSSNNIYSSVKINGKIRRIKSKGFTLWQGDFKRWTWAHAKEIGVLKNQVTLMKPNQVLSILTEFHFKRTSVLTLKGKPKRCDSSNRIKPIHDAIADLIHLDDSYFWDGAFTKRITEDDTESCSVEIKLIDLPLTRYPHADSEQQLIDRACVESPLKHSQVQG